MIHLLSVRVDPMEVSTKNDCLLKTNVMNH